jgi:hypothetical protein
MSFTGRSATARRPNRSNPIRTDRKTRKQYQKELLRDLVDVVSVSSDSTADALISLELTS